MARELSTLEIALSVRCWSSLQTAHKPILTGGLGARRIKRFMGERIFDIYCLDHCCCGAHAGRIRRSDRSD